MKNFWHFKVKLGCLIRKHNSFALLKTASLYWKATMAFNLWPSCLCFLKVEVISICHPNLYKTWFLYVLINNIQGDGIGCNFRLFLPPFEGVSLSWAIQTAFFFFSFFFFVDTKLKCLRKYTCAEYIWSSKAPHI